MKLLTHNMLTSKCMKGVSVGYPLGLNASDVRVSEVDFNPEFVAKMIPKLDWSVLYNAAESIGQLEDLPKELISNYENNPEFLKKVHHVLLEVDIINGELICPETGRKFPINNGIPNMLLNEDEV
ncbi:multifunctional methyltransferase subunit TRM112-like protein [Leptinotarsa decemlineata]|uniref:multifunctional methyltransferase subunit TRM112-like protein n=1 Tax=Leptinotarsa decemlineata TaxID=7539 RepID=UPI000C2541B1|nr:multifunctional methyltransferase subunit TRM112-like protein [Leptinotarsa decemlineata]